MREKRLDFPTQFIVAVTGLVQEYRTVVASARSRLVVEAVNALPAISVHDSAEFYANGCDGDGYLVTLVVA